MHFTQLENHGWNKRQTKYNLSNCCNYAHKMSGFINQKDRILDTILTNEGRKHLALGKITPAFYSFTDSGAFYSHQDTFASGSQDMVARLHLESSNLPQDQITFEVDDSGRLSVPQLRKLSPSGSYNIVNGQFFSGSNGAITGSTEFLSLSDALTQYSIDNFKNLYILSSPENVFNERINTDFSVENKRITFKITDENPIASTNESQIGNINHIESLFADKRLSHVPNYKFLPPVNKKNIKGNNNSLGNFVPIEQQPIFDFADLKKEIEWYRQNGFSQKTSFMKTSQENRVVCQFFEMSDERISKLDVIDFGIFVDENNKTKHVFFAGKVFLDENNNHTFVSAFTLIFA